MSVEVRTTFNPDQVIEVSDEEALSLRVQGLLTEESTKDGAFVEGSSTEEADTGLPEEVDITDEVIDDALKTKKRKG